MEDKENEDLDALSGGLCFSVWLCFLLIGWLTDASIWWMAFIGFVAGVAVGMLSDHIGKGKERKNEMERRQALRDSETKKREAARSKERAKRQAAYNEEGAKRRAAYDEVKSYVVAHLETLIMKRRSLTRTGDYGEVYDAGWENEIRTFLQATLSEGIFERIGIGKESAMELFSEYVGTIVYERSKEYRSDANSRSVAQAGAIQYLRRCTELLETYRWAVWRPSSDEYFDIDLVAKKQGRSVAIKCEKSIRLVDETPVEMLYVSAAANGISECVVVTNYQFAESARKLAGKLSVSLIHHSDLENL